MELILIRKDATVKKNATDYTVGVRSLVHDAPTTANAKAVLIVKLSLAQKPSKIISLIAIEKKINSQLIIK